MKKFLAILLIAFIVCQTVEEQDMNGWWKKLWDKIKKAVKKAWNWLKNNGWLDKIKNALITAGKYAAVALCKRWFDEETCNGVIGEL